MSLISFATLRQIELNSDVARFTTHVRTSFSTTQALVSCVNTELYLLKLRGSHAMCRVTSLAAKQVCLGPVKRATWNKQNKNE